MALHNPIHVEVFDSNDEIIGPVTRPISITNNLDAFRFDYVAVQMETTDPFGNEIYQRFIDDEHLQYRIHGRFGESTGDINSVYKYKRDGKGEVSFYGRSHKEIMFSVLGFPSPDIDAPQGQSTVSKVYTGSELAIIRQVLADNVRDRLGVPFRFQSGDLGKNFRIDFRFDEIAAHLYDDAIDRGGLLLEKRGDIVVDIHRDFNKHEYVLTARLQEHHEKVLSDVGGNISAYESTHDRGEAARLIVGGPGENRNRTFVDLPYPDAEYAAGAGQAVSDYSDKIRLMEENHKAAVELARDQNKPLQYIQNLEKDHEARLKFEWNSFVVRHRNRSLATKPSVAHPRRGFPAEAFTENTNPDTAAKSEESATYKQKVDAIREAGTKKLEELGPKAGLKFTINETDQVYLGPDGAFRMGDWVRIEIDGVDFGEIQLTKAVMSFTRDEGYKLQLSDTELTESYESAQVDRIARAMRELTNGTRRA